MNKKQMIGAVVAAGLFIMVGVSSVFTNTLSSTILENTKSQLLSGGVEISLPASPYVGVVSVEGTIEAQAGTDVFSDTQSYLHNTTIEYVEEMMHDSSNRGILLYVDSPGGAVYEAEELYDKLLEYKEKTGRKIWTYMSHYAASGGYYVSMASDKIYANPNTTTGSIGVIISGLNINGLYEKLGIKEYSITSGKNKDMSEMNEEQIAIYQSVVDEAFDRFVEIVGTGRNIPEEQVREIADGRIYTAKQALSKDLIDEISLYEDMQAEMEEEFKTSVFYEPSHKSSVLSDLFGQLKELKPESDAEIAADFVQKHGKGVPMYYAEGLQ